MGITKIHNTAVTSILTINDVLTSGISKINDVDLGGGGGTPWRSNIYDFNSEATNTNAASDWAPSTAYAADGWVNGLSAVNGTTWSSPGINTKGWNCDFGTTPSSLTGPDGGMTSITNGTPLNSSAQRYVYKETSSGRNSWDHIARTPGYNFSSLMNNTSNNLRLVFWYHAFGSTGWSGDLFTVYVDTGLTSNTSLATTLYSLPASGNLMSSGASPYIVQNIDLNAYRTSPATYYFYLLMNPQTSGITYRHDIAFDSLYFEEY